MRPLPTPRLPSAPRTLFAKWVLVLLPVLVAALEAASPEIFEPPHLPRPSHWRSIAAGEFNRPDGTRIATIGASHHPWASAQELQSLAAWFVDSADGRAAWESETRFAAQVVNQWHLPKTGFGNGRYVYSLHYLTRLSLVHLFTGHELLGEFLKQQLSYIAGLPQSFWLHSELRGDKADLETAQTGVAFANCLAACPDLFSMDEIAAMNATLRSRALEPCLASNWLRTEKANNHTIVLATGALVMGRYLDDNRAQQRAVERLAWYVRSKVEQDGSYGEGIGYFYYPLDALFSAALAMSPAQLKAVFSATPLEASSRWLAYHYFLVRPEGTLRYDPLRAHFHDNSYWGRLPATGAALLALLYHDGLARWLSESFHDAKSDGDEDSVELTNWRSFLLMQRCGGTLPAAKSPAELRLPTLAAFASGDNFIRSGWEDNGVTLGLENAGPTRTDYSHHHACRNSVILAALGEYLIVSPGSASYRSPLHVDYDLSTRAQNTVEIDGMNQLLPRRTSNAGIADGRPAARTTLLATSPTVEVLASDATQSYAQPHKRIGRVIIFVRAAKYFVMFDQLESLSGKHTYTWRLHFNNRDRAASLSAPDPAGAYLLLRPKAALQLFVAADAPLSSTVNDARMHGPGRDYSPGGVNEGPLGSAIELAVYNSSPESVMQFVSVLRPVESTAASNRLPVRFNGHTLHVGEDEFSLRDNQLTITTGGVTESHLVW